MCLFMLMLLTSGISRSGWSRSGKAANTEVAGALGTLAAALPLMHRQQQQQQRQHPADRGRRDGGGGGGGGKEARAVGSAYDYARRVVGELVNAQKPARCAAAAAVARTGV